MHVLVIEGVRLKLKSRSYLYRMLGLSLLFDGDGRGKEGGREGGERGGGCTPRKCLPFLRLVVAS